MVDDGINKGIASVKVDILGSAPNITKQKKYNFDTGAFAWTKFVNSPFFSPLLTENIIDSDAFAACYPSKRKWHVNNFLDGGADEAAYSGTEPIITWTPLDPSTISAETGVINKIVTADAEVEYEGFPDYTLIMPGGYSSAPPDYIGPKWSDNSIEKEVFPDDAATIKVWADLYDVPLSAPSIVPPVDELIPWINCVSQNVVRDGLFWGIESDDFVEKNMPFFVTFKKMFPPTTSKHETCLIISLGINDVDNKNRFDLYLAMNKKPVLIDYQNSDAADADENWKEFEFESSRQLTYNENLEVGFMTIAGRLIIFVDGEPMVYTRVNKEEGDDGGKLLECKIHPGAIRVWGTNMQCRINASPMVFAPISLLAIPIPQIIDSSGDSSISLPYTGVTYDGGVGPSVCHLPTPPTYPTQLYGCDCLSFSGDAGDATPEGFGFHQEGDVTFIKASEDTFGMLPSTDFYVLVMKSEDTIFGGEILPRGGTPYFFRLKGGHVPPDEEDSGSGADVSDFVISVDETDSAPDYFHTKKSATVTLYNENGVITDGISGITGGHKGIRIAWAWSDGEAEPEYQRTFTGLIVNVNKTEEAGRELVTLTCEDYIYVLKNVPIVNSPFYDGMVAFYAVRDLAERAGVKRIENEWEDEDSYFLPAGFSFSKPAMRFGVREKLFDCIINIVKRYEAFIRFDEDGEMKVEKLPGGLFSVATPPVMDFGSDPTSPNIILNKRTIDYNYDSIINNISVLTVERDTRNAIIYGKTATEADDRLLFRKSYLYDQPALGELEVAKSYANDLALRVFKPILKTQVETIGGTTIGLIPLDFITVDEQEFRVMSIKRKFNAESNDFTESFDAEWTGG